MKVEEAAAHDVADMVSCGELHVKCHVQVPDSVD